MPETDMQEPKPDMQEPEKGSRKRTKKFEKKNKIKKFVSVGFRPQMNPFYCIST